MTCRGRSRRSAGPAGAGRGGSRASSPARRGRTWPGTSTRTRPRTCSRRASARAALTWPAPATWGCGTPTRSLTCPRRGQQTIQHDRHEVQCACGRTHVADAPPEAAGAPGTVTYGLNFQAWCVFLMVMHHVPVERCADIIESMSGTRPSDGWVHALLEPRRPGGRRGEQGDPGADHPGPRHLRRRDPAPGRARARRPARSTCRSPARTC